MSISKKLLAVAAFSALTVATAVPALALENEFHGLFRARAEIGNYDNYAAGALVPSRSTPVSAGYIEQRARLLYMAKANDDLKLVTHFEIDSRWGDQSYNTNNSLRNAGGAIGADQVNLETKNVYLDFNIPATKVNVKAGIQGYTDPYKGIIFNNDAAGVSTKATLGNATIGLTYFRFDDATTTVTTPAAGANLTTTTAIPGFGPAGVIANGTGPDGTTALTNTQLGNRTRDFLTLGGKFNVTKDIKFGADYFLLYSDVLRNSQDKTNIHMVGLNAEAKAGNATVDGFLLYQMGKLGRANPTPATNVTSNSQVVNAYAANVGVKCTAGTGTARMNALYISGDNNPNVGDRNDFQTIMERSAGTAGHSFYPGEMMLLLRSKYNLNTDKAVVFDLNNAGQGLIGGFLGYDLNVGKVFVYTNLGMAAVAKDRDGTKSDSNYIGTEINTEIGYKMYDNLTTSVQAAYMVLGDFFKPASGSQPVDPYVTRIQLNYTF
jgi:Alginate export